MTLKELQQMIKEEFDAYQNEATDDVDVSVTDDDVDVDAEMGGEEEAAGEEDVLRSIYDLLAAHFEGGDEDMGDDMGDEVGDDVEGEEGDVEETYMENEDSDLDELTNHGVGKSAKNSSGANAGYTNAKALQERFQKLANIIK